MELVLATLASALAGFIDSIVGGGGLVLLPALFALYPSPPHPPPCWAPTKAHRSGAPAFATWQYSRRVAMQLVRHVARRMPGNGGVFLRRLAG
jgi:uncharacterized membrane protein YfcA